MPEPPIDLPPPYRTKSGREITDAEIQAWAEMAERDPIVGPGPPLPRTSVNITYPKLWVVVLVVFITVLVTNLIWLVVEPRLAPVVANWLQQIGEIAWSTSPA